MDAPVEPPACFAAFSTEAGGLHYSWRGRGPGQKATTIGIYNPVNEEWTLKPTTGSPPRGLGNGGCVFIANHLYCFGGFDGSSWFNDLHKLNLETFQWSKVHTNNDPSEYPICKVGCGMVFANEQFLVCFGGYGIGPTQPGSTFTRDTLSTDGRGWTNKFHLFDVQEGVWSSPSVKGERPPPCSHFSFTKVYQDTVVLFGGLQPGHVIVNDLYLFNLRKMEVTKVEPVQGEPWPVERNNHAACCLNYGKDHPKLLVFGGLGEDNKVLGDMWILDVDTGKWTEVTPPESVKPHYLHSTTATSLGPGLTEVLVFGGHLKFVGDPIAETTILRFECPLSVNGPPTEKWALVDVAHNQTRGSRVRLKEKREKIRQANHGESHSEMCAVSSGQQAELVVSDTSRSRAVTGTRETMAFKRFIKNYGLSSDQLDFEIAEGDVTYLAQHFDNVELYLRVFGLTTAEQVNVRRMVHVHDNQIAMAECLSLWRRHNPSTATLRALLEILLSLRKEEIALNVCGYYHPKHEPSPTSS